MYCFPMYCTWALRISNEEIGASREIQVIGNGPYDVTEKISIRLTVSVAVP